MAKSNVNTLYTKMALFQDTFFLFLNKQVYKKCNFPTYFYERKIPVEIVDTNVKSVQFFQVCYTFWNSCQHC